MRFANGGPNSWAERKELAFGAQYSVICYALVRGAELGVAETSRRSRPHPCHTCYATITFA